MTTATKTVPAAAKRAEPTRRELTEVQEIICDSVADLLLNGGYEEDLDSLLWAATTHHWERSFAHGREVSENIRKEAKEMASKYFAEWRADIVTARKRNQRAPAEEQAEPKSVADRIRANVIDELRRNFEWFLDESSPEERMLMNQILMEQMNCGMAPFLTRGEIALGQAFEYQLGKSRCYVRVPERFVKKIQGYMDALLEVEDAKEVA